MKYSRSILFLILSLLSVVSFAKAPVWQIINKESSVSFTATQNNAPVTGAFTSFTGEIHADPNQLNESDVKIVIDLNSLTTSYDELTDTLKAAEWFNIKLFPQAIFTAAKFNKINANTFQAQGSLTLRDITLPVVLTFTYEPIDKDKARVKGSARLKRTAFGVGQGEWKSTAEIKDEVQVNFVLTAKKNAA